MGVAYKYVAWQQVSVEEVVGVDEGHATADVSHDPQPLSPFHVGLVHMQNEMETASHHLLTDESTDFLLVTDLGTQQLDHVRTL